MSKHRIVHFKLSHNIKVNTAPCIFVSLSYTVWLISIELSASSLIVSNVQSVAVTSSEFFHPASQISI